MRYAKRKAWLAIVIVVAFVLFSEMPPGLSLAQETETGPTPQATTPERRLIQISGTGEVTVQPDVAVFFAGVETEAEDPGTAISQNSEQAQELIDALIQAGVSQENIQTQLVSLQPIYAQPEVRPEGAQASQVTGYRAINIVRVRTEDLENLGELLNTVIEAGANRIDSLFFEATSQTAVFNEALQAAWEDAQQKAQALAELANIQLGDVFAISTDRVGALGVPEGVGLGGAGGAVPIEPGTQTVTVNLLVSWEFLPRDGAATRTPTPATTVPTSPTPGTPTPTLPTSTPLMTGTLTTTPTTPTIPSTPSTTTIPSTPTALPSNIATRARELLGEQLGLTLQDITFVSAERQNWPDACLGLARANEVCAQVVTPGWLIVLEANGRTFQVRTDLTGDEVRVVEQPTTAVPTTTAQLTPTVGQTPTAQLTTTITPTTATPTATGQAPTS